MTDPLSLILLYYYHDDPCHTHMLMRHNMTDPLSLILLYYQHQQPRHFDCESVDNIRVNYNHIDVIYGLHLNPDPSILLYYHHLPRHFDHEIDNVIN